MSKRRLVDEKIRESQTFSALTYRQRDMWHGLIVSADDQGRLPGAPNFVRSRIWPYDEVPQAEVEADLAALELSGNIHRYSVAGACYIQIVNWWRYQQMQWAGPSNYPAPESWIDRLRYHAHGNKIVTQEWDKLGGYPPIPPEEVPSPLPSQLPTPINEGEGEGEGKGEGEGEIKSVAGAKTAPAAAAKNERPELEELLIANSRPGTILQAELEQYYQSKRRSVPRHFQSHQQKQEFDKVFAALGEKLQPLVAKGLARERSSLPNLLGWLQSCAKNERAKLIGERINGRQQQSQPEGHGSRSGQTPSGPGGSGVASGGQASEIARRLSGGK